MSPVTDYINILTITITLFSKLTGVWELFFYVITIFPIHSYEEISNFGSAAVVLICIL